jgi:threonine/homoserine/homoserine lactone efflux protein
MWKAFVFGVIVSGTVGPIALLIFGTGARQGFGAGATAALGAALADFLYALAAFLLGALVLPFLAGNRTAIDVACALLLIGFGAWMVFAQLRPGRPAEAPGQASQHFLPTFLLTFLNPMTLVIFAGFVPQLPVAGSLAMAAGLALALGAGSAAVGVGFAGAGAALGKAMPGERGRRAISLAAAAGILAFGVYGLVTATA